PARRRGRPAPARRLAGWASLSGEGPDSRASPDRQEKAMFTHPDRIGQLAREHHHQMLAQASQRQLRHQHSRPAATTRIIRRLAALIAGAGAMPALEHPEFGGDSILPRCSRLGDRYLPRYRRLTEPQA
ncbi:MAG TPA: hypothetical protein VEH31_23320, partial [Streptosporangiaceae bacterium]|nr:hypothetical protein [Streptosporangiaceae bacterium]